MSITLLFSPYHWNYAFSFQKSHAMFLAVGHPPCSCDKQEVIFTYNLLPSIGTPAVAAGGFLFGGRQPTPRGTSTPIAVCQSSSTYPIGGHIWDQRAGGQAASGILLLLLCPSEITAVSTVHLLPSS